MEIIAYTFDFVGKLLIAFTAVMVHHRVQKEHKIDKRVFDEMKRERMLALIGIALMALGYLLHVLPFLSI